MFSVCGNPVTCDPHAQLLAWEGAGWLFSLLQCRIGSLQSTKLHFILRKEFELILGWFFLMVCACRFLSRDQVSYSLPASLRELKQRKRVVWYVLGAAYWIASVVSQCCMWQPLLKLVASLDTNLGDLSIPSVLFLCTSQSKDWKNLELVTAWK